MSENTTEFVDLHNKDGRVTVLGSSIMNKPLCDSSDARIIIIRDISGSPMILLVRLAGDTWGISTPDDKDWAAMCARFGVH